MQWVPCPAVQFVELGPASISDTSPQSFFTWFCKYTRTPGLWYALLRLTFVCSSIIYAELLVVPPKCIDVPLCLEHTQSQTQVHRTFKSCKTKNMHRKHIRHPFSPGCLCCSTPPTCAKFQICWEGLPTTFFLLHGLFCPRSNFATL